MTERVDHTAGFEGCEQYITQERWTHPQGVEVKRQFGIYARSEKEAMYTSRILFVWILRQLGFKP